MRLGRRGLRWDVVTLERFLADPAAVVPGTSMSFVGLMPGWQQTGIDACHRGESLRFVLCIPAVSTVYVRHSACSPSPWVPSEANDVWQRFAAGDKRCRFIE